MDFPFPCYEPKSTGPIIIGPFLLNLVYFCCFLFHGGIIAGFGIYFLLEANKTAGVVPVALPAIITAIGFLLALSVILACLGKAFNKEQLLKAVIKYLKQ